MTLRRLRPAGYRVTPWKDGGGSTTQIAIEPPDATLADPFRWRLSSARVEASGPFSRFPGYRRILALLEGPGMVLAFEDGAALRLDDPLRPVAFDGDRTVHATLLGGPCVDLGIIYDPARFACAMEVMALGPEPALLRTAGTTLLLAPKGGVAVDGAALGPLEGLRWAGEGEHRAQATHDGARLIRCSIEDSDS